MGFPPFRRKPKSERLPVYYVYLVNDYKVNESYSEKKKKKNDTPSCKTENHFLVVL